MINLLKTAHISIMQRIMQRNQKPMTKPQVIAAFTEWWNKNPPAVRSDKVGKRCAWNDFVDECNKKGLVSNDQANNWCNPFDKSS